MPLKSFNFVFKGFFLISFFFLSKTVESLFSARGSMLFSKSFFVATRRKQAGNLRLRSFE